MKNWFLMLSIRYESNIGRLWYFPLAAAGPSPVTKSTASLRSFIELCSPLVPTRICIGAKAESFKRERPKRLDASSNIEDKHQKIKAMSPFVDGWLQCPYCRSVYYILITTSNEETFFQYFASHACDDIYARSTPNQSWMFHRYWHLLVGSWTHAYCMDVSITIIRPQGAKPWYRGKHLINFRTWCLEQVLLQTDSEALELRENLEEMFPRYWEHYTHYTMASKKFNGNFRGRIAFLPWKKWLHIFW